MITTIGNHKITCQSIESPEVDAMLSGEKVRVLYSDPPWGDGNMKYWVTMNKKMTGKAFSPLSYDQLLTRIEQLIDRYVDGFVFIETGPRWVDQLLQRFERRYFGVQSVSMKYSGKHVCWLVGASTSRAYKYPADFQALGKLTGAPVPRTAVGAVSVPNGIVLDPCCGMGYTARAAVAAGMRFRGNEFNAKRLQKTINFLQGTV